GRRPSSIRAGAPCRRRTWHCSGCWEGDSGPDFERSTRSVGNEKGPAVPDAVARQRRGHLQPDANVARPPWDTRTIRTGTRAFPDLHLPRREWSDQLAEVVAHAADPRRR